MQMQVKLIASGLNFDTLWNFQYLNSVSLLPKSRNNLSIFSRISSFDYTDGIKEVILSFTEPYVDDLNTCQKISMMLAYDLNCLRIDLFVIQ